MIDYFDLGDQVKIQENTSLYSTTREIIKACSKNPYTEFQEFRVAEQGDSRSEYIVIEAGDGTVNGGNPGGIRRCERLAIEVNPKYQMPIMVRALRKSFPSLSHQHFSQPNTPKTLCIYEAAWSAEERSWTAEKFLQRIFWWLKESSELRLHREDQPLEQLFYLSPYQLILPSNHSIYANSTTNKLSIQEVNGGSPITWKAVPEDSDSSVKSIQMLTIEVPPVEDTKIAMFPQSLGELHDQLLSWNSGLKDQLYGAIFDAIPDGIKPSADKGEALIILVWIPRLRNDDIERTDVMGYVVNASLYELAESLDILGPPGLDGQRFRFKALNDQITSHWQKVPLLPVEILPSLDASYARDLSAIEHGNASFYGVLAGVGALGSILADIWARSGWGQWSYIDPDQLLPHNLVRHVGFDGFLGLPKTTVVQHLVKLIYPNEPEPNAIAKNVLIEDSDVIQALNAAQLVVDVTTTLEVPRSLAMRDDTPRTVSLFLTPSGLSSVMLLEDLKRKQRIDALEGQYYRAILNQAWGETHLQNHSGDRWVGGGCRSISLRLSNECIHSHAGLLSRQLRKSVIKDEARLCIWTSDESSGSISAHEIDLFSVVSKVIGSWTVKYDLGLIDKIKYVRQCALPNETGGAILGVTDFKNKTIILVDILPAPSDSESSPTHFVRGKEGQTEALERVQALTARVVDYVGDWHSHPQGASSQVSCDDEKLIATLHKRMDADGLPAVMLIASEYDFNIVVR
ncbi:ThiF family adenylyltransferase [Vreelandella titanicae]|uniref:ThiF family adenylyltransferase n=1 Tax=Vreelandella titanicae TaxID=664683 RepID=UPI0039BFC81D